MMFALYMSYHVVVCDKITYFSTFYLLLESKCVKQMPLPPDGVQLYNINIIFARLPKLKAVYFVNS